MTTAAGTITGFSAYNQNVLVTTERVASVISLLGCCFVMTTFFLSARFRKPVNRLIFYATIGNTVFNVGTLISINGMQMGSDSPLCQFQGFLIQMFLPADAFWNLAMAVNTYLTVFRKYNAAQCRAMEKWYLMFNFGIFGLIAFVYCFVNNSGGHNGKVYGSAVLWCWIRRDWDIFRIATCYAPAWVAIVVCFTIYLVSGRRLYMQERKLSMIGQSPSGSFIENPFTSYKTTEVHITSEPATPGHHLTNQPSESQIELQSKNIQRQYLGGRGNFEEYSVTIERREGPLQQLHRNTNEDEIRLRDTAVQANKVAKSYALCCILFFVSLLITWIPSSIFRVYLLFNDPTSNFGMAYATGLVLPLMGFWNALIYITISWDAVLDMFAGDIDRRVWRAWHGRPSRTEWSSGERKSKDSWGTRTRRLSLNSKDDTALATNSTKDSTDDPIWNRS